MPICWPRCIAAGFLALAVMTGHARAMDVSPIPIKRPYEVYTPKLRWDHLPKGVMWTQATMRFIARHGRKLPQTVPRDIADYCPGYASQTLDRRAAFWAGLLSSLAFHESTWRETAVGGGGLWFGLVQIAPPTADWRRCNVRSGQALKNGVDNLSCAVRIMNITVPRDQVVSAGMRGVAADWGPFHSRKKREDMMRWSKRQPYCAHRFTDSPFPRLRPQRDVGPKGDDMRLGGAGPV